MLTESVSDPRRANWLTISSMTEDLCWPEETSTARPTWELEAEILRLTTRLMMRERELRQVKNQLKSQTTTTQQQAKSWKRRMEEKEDQMKELLVQKDAEMQNIVSQLMLFEAELLREQARIEELLGEKDAQILSQQREIERLKRHRAPETEVDVTRERATTPLRDQTTCAGTAFGRKAGDPTTGDIPNRAWDVRDHGATEYSSSSADDKTGSVGDRVPGRDSNSPSWTRTNSSLTTIDGWAEMETAMLSDSDSMNQTTEYESLVRRLPSCRRSTDSDNNSCTVSSSGVSSIFNNSSLPSSYNRLEPSKGNSGAPRSFAVFEDRLQRDSQHAVQKLKDGLVKMRAIQDVTNVKNLDPLSDTTPTKRAPPFKSPQKMKDLKAKRITHKIHRPVMPEMTAQAIL